MDPVRKNVLNADEASNDALSNGVDGLKNKKIAFIITKSNWGGAQAYVHTLATHFKSEAADVVVLLGGTGEKGAATGVLAERLENGSVRTVTIDSFTRNVGFLRELRTLYALYRALRSERPDIVHSNSSKAGGLGSLAARLARVPRIVFTSHGLAYDEDRPIIARTLIWLSTWMTFMLCHRVIVISKDTYTRARRLPFCSKKIRLVPNGIEPQRLLERREAREKLLSSEMHEEVWIGTIAELTKNKNLASLIQAAALLKQRDHRFTLCVISPGEEYDALRALITELDLADCVHLLGFVPHASTLLEAFDIFALVSIKEGLPYVLLEAAQAACAVVATRIPGVTDIIDEATGLLVEPRDVAAIATALETLLRSSEKRGALGRSLQDKVRKEFSIDRMLEETRSVYCAS